MDILNHQHKADRIANWLYGFYNHMTFDDFLQSDILAVAIHNTRSWTE